jgi:hypothetical protein
MGDYDNWIRRILLTAGVVEVVVGVSHFAMPYFAYHAKGFTLLNQHEINFVTLCVFAVGILLIAFGAVTICFSFNTHNEMLLPYTIIQSILWLARIIIEILYPVKIGLFWIRQPTNVVISLLILEWLLFVLSALWVTMNRRMSNLSSTVPHV